jgi:hypothetical protein
MIIVFDTNIWLSQLGMRSATASAVRFFLRQNDYRLALPEVVRMEVEINLKNDLMKFINGIKDSHEQLLTTFQTLTRVTLPTEAEVEALIPQLFESVGVELITIPFSLESARNSLLKTIHKQQPSNNTQQFKDGVLWADCLGLLETDNVTLVTADKAFYRGHVYEKGLASNLQFEADQYPYKIHLMENLAALLETLPKTIPFDEGKLVGVALAAAESNVHTYLAEGFEIGAPPRITRSIFATENPEKLFFECSISIPCPDISGLNRDDASLIIDADGLYLPGSKSFEGLGLKTVSFKFHNRDGVEEERRGVWLRAGGVGHREITSVIRHRLDDATI